MNNSSCIVRTLCIGGIALLGGCIITAPQFKPEPASTDPKTLQRTALSGSGQRLGFYYMVNPDCSPGGVPKILVEQQPAHGAVAISDAQDYTNFPASNQRYGCNKQKSPGAVLSYTSESGYKGSDQVSVKAIYSDGGVKTVNYAITVE